MATAADHLPDDKDALRAARIEDGADPNDALARACQKAGDDVRALGVGAMTTFAGAVFIARKQGDGTVSEAYIATQGDSRALLMTRDGKITVKIYAD